MASIICTCKSTIRGTTPRIVYGRVTIIWRSKNLALILVIIFNI
jgi:hypothetical protein